MLSPKCLIATIILPIFLISTLYAQHSSPLPKTGYWGIENADVFSIEDQNGFKYQQTKLFSDYVANVLIGKGTLGIEIFEKSTKKSLYRFYPIGIEFTEISRDLNRSFPIYKYTLIHTLAISPKNPDESVDVEFQTNNGEVYSINIYFKSSSLKFHISYTVGF